MGAKSPGELRNYREVSLVLAMLGAAGRLRRVSALRVLPVLLFCAGMSACSVLHSRPVHQMSYAEAAVRSAAAAGAETSQPYLYQLARDALLRAHSAYRLKNFDMALKLAIRARRIAEDAETKALSGQIEAEKIYTPESEGAVEVE